MSNGQVIQILLVEDSDADIRLTQEAMKEAKVRNDLHVVRDGEAALEFLRSDHPRPDLILLDLNLPKKDGREVLAEIKNDPMLMSIPVVVLTTSKADKDILHSYRLHANCYIQKPMDLDRFLEIVKTIQNFWLTIVHLPPEN
ncbi:response regulator [Haliangium sp.]|uniref:response regulator n=1 Tax=Haliangium sp. TaxID=2663208 RepID=UPI003D12EA39